MTQSPPQRPPSVRPVRYKGGDLDAERGPGLGCFYVQLVVLAVLVVLTPVSVNLGWPDWASALLLFATIAVLLVSGQTMVFLLRLVAADRREGRRRPLAARSRTVGELEDSSNAESDGPVTGGPVVAPTDGGTTGATGGADRPAEHGPMRE